MKVLILVMILIACTGVGLEMTSRLKCRVRLLEAMGTMVRDLRSRMVQLGMTLPQALEEFARDLERPQGLVAACVQEELTVEGTTLPEAWRRSIERLHREHRQFCCLHADDITRLSEVGLHLGEMDMASQERAMDFAEQSLQGQITQAAANAARLGKLYNTMGVLVGMGLVVLMI